MYLRDFLKVLPFVVISLSLVHADTHECASNDTLKTNLAAQVKKVTDVFDPIVANTSLTDDQKGEMILGAICDPNKGIEDIREIENILKMCPALANDASVTSLTFGDLKFQDLFLYFSSVDNFCECMPSFMQALMMKAFKAYLVDQKANAKYPVFQLGQLCVAQQQQQVRNAALKIEMDRQKCMNVWRFTTFLKEKSTMFIKDFLDQGNCDEFNNTLFMCAVDKSTGANFKTCISNAADISCERNECVMDNFGDSCGDGNEWYKWAVEMLDPGMFEVKEECGENGVASVVATTYLLIVSLCAYVLY